MGHFIVAAALSRRTEIATHLAPDSSRLAALLIVHLPQVNSALHALPAGRLGHDLAQVISARLPRGRWSEASGSPWSMVRARMLPGFELPPELPLLDTPLSAEIEAHNDDASYLRALWLKMDSIGGYLAVQPVARGQY